jgi:tyrosine-protein kinase Etk/Wzc
MNSPQQPPVQDTQLTQQNDQTNLLDLFDVVLDSRNLIIAVTIVSILVGGVYAFFSTPIYEANTLVQVEESKGGSAASSALGDAASLFEIRSPATAEMEILRSRMIVGQAVQNLQLDYSVVPKHLPLIGGWLARRATAPSNPGFWGATGYVSGNESLKVSNFDVPREFEAARFSVVLTSTGYDLLSPDGEQLAKGKLGQAVEFILAGRKGSLFIVSAVGLPGAEFYIKRFSKLVVTEGLQRRLAIAEQGRQSGVIRTTLSGPDAAQIALILNEIGTLYVRQNIARKAAEAEKTLGFLSTLLPQLRMQADESETKFNQFRNRNSTFDLGVESKLVLEQSVKLQMALLELQQKRKETESRFTAQHPTVQTIDAQIKNINTEIGVLAGKVKVFPSVEQDLLRLTRDLKVNSELYASLLNSAQQLRLVKEGKIGNVRIVDTATVPELPIRPQRMTLLTIAGVLGLIFGLALAFVRNSLRPGIKDPIDIEQRLGLSVFATVPYSKAQEFLIKKIKGKVEGNHMLAVIAPQDPAIESLRSLRTALQFAMLDAPNNIVLITGPTPGIGKSFTSANFVAVLASVNKKVLLIDADLRKGHLNQYFGIPRGNGLSDVVSGSITFQDAIHKNVLPNVDFIATGTLPPNPAEVLMTCLGQELIQRVSGNYDFIVIDTAPVLVASDASIIAPVAGAVFLISRAEVTSIGELEEAVNRLKKSGSQTKGVIFNGLNTTKSRYGYGTGYRYGRYRYTNYEY